MKITEKLRSFLPNKAQEQSTPAESSATPAQQPKAHKNPIKDLFSKHSTSKPAAARNTGTIQEPSTSLATGIAVADAGSAPAHHHAVAGGDGGGGGFSGGDGGGGGGGDGGGGGASC